MASKQKMTPWFPKRIKPRRVGVYKTREHDGTTFYNHWDGSCWHWGDVSAASASSDDPIPGELQSELVAGWRGLAEKPA